MSADNSHDFLGSVWAVPPSVVDAVIAMLGAAAVRISFAIYGRNT